MATDWRGLALAVLMLGASILSANATSGPGCFYVVNVASWDVLNIRSGPSHRTTVVGTIDPNSHGIISPKRRLPAVRHAVAKTLVPDCPLHRRRYHKRICQKTLSCAERLPVTGLTAAFN